MADFGNVAEMMEKGQMQDVQDLTSAALDEGMAPTKVLDELIAGLDVVGDRYSRGEVFLPELLVAGKSMQSALVVLRPKLAESGEKPIGRAVIGTVRGDVHEIGKNVFGMMLEGAGFEVIDLGPDVSTEKFVAAVKENNPQIVGLSGLLSTTIPEMPRIIDALKEAGLRDGVHILVGGAPVTPEFAKDIGADAGGMDAAAATEVARKMMAA
jgi:5-methyltetrahydrofolate--homocysteine methyltransferase